MTPQSIAARTEPSKRRRTLMRALAGLTALGAAALLAAFTSIGCGLITAPISVPEAFTHNNFLGLHGTIFDDQGQPVDDVVVTVKRDYYLWHADYSYSDYDTMTVAANHTFDIPARRAHQLDFAFDKPGFAEQKITVEQKAISANDRWLVGSHWPLESAVEVMMARSNRQAPPLKWLALDVDLTDPGNMPVVDLSGALPSTADLPDAWDRDRTILVSQNALHVLDAGATLPPHVLYAIVERQPTKTSGPEHRVDPLDLNMPARIAIRINDSDAGFASCTPLAGTSPLNRMTQAPQTGYAPELGLPGKRLRQLRDPASDLILDRNEFAYFRANGLYGKLVISWSCTCGDAENLRLFIAAVIQPDGTRNLATHLAQ